MLSYSIKESLDKALEKFQAPYLFIELLLKFKKKLQI